MTGPGGSARPHPGGPRPVIAGIDGSAGARDGARFAAAEARLHQAPLRLVHALSWPLRGLVTPPPPGTRLPVIPHGSAETVLEEHAAAAAETISPDRISWAVVEGPPAEALQAASAGAQLLVLGSRGAGGVAGRFVGSTTRDVVAAAECPVVVVPAESPVTASGRRSVVVGVEGRPGDEDVLRVAFAEAAARGTDLVAVHARQDGLLGSASSSTTPPGDRSCVQADEQRVLAGILAGCRDAHPDVAVREVVVREKPAVGLRAAGLTAEL
ncbi:hypothetical protein A7K94_0204965, partial [Modestobacter sp. VKM Ac-2676]